MLWHPDRVKHDGSTHSGELFAWGEWEAQSELLRPLGGSRADGYPQHLWRAYYTVPVDGRYDGLRNTDPFIFGSRFLYSNCQQPSRPGLRSLGRGSVIAFGSYKTRQWVLDTVFVVAGSVPYTASQADRELEDPAPDVEVPRGPRSTPTLRRNHADHTRRASRRRGNRFECTIRTLLAGAGLSPHDQATAATPLLRRTGDPRGADQGGSRATRWLPCQHGRRAGVTRRYS